MALLLHLQRTGRATAADLASELEVSERTIYRDIASLQAAGVPLWTETGPGGGVRLVEGWHTDLDGLTADEAGALFLAGTPGAAAELGLGTVLAAAQTKMLAGLPPELRGRAARVRERFYVDAPGWFHRDEPVPHLSTLAQAVWAEQRVDLRYRRADREVRRRVDPLGLVLKAGTWYLVARHRDAVRTYRVGRVTAAERRDERATRPAGFALDRYWLESARDFDRSILRAQVRLRLDGRALRHLPSVTDAAAATEAIDGAGDADPHGWREVVLAVESHEVALDQLVALGAGVEVLEPASLRRALAGAGESIRRNNS